MNEGSSDGRQINSSEAFEEPRLRWPDEKRYHLSVNVILENEEGHILLLKRSHDSLINPGRWDLPGGKVDACENFQDAIHREVKEEIGLDVRLTHLIGSSDYRVIGTNVVFLIMHGEIGPEDIRLSREHDEYLWIIPTLIPEMDLCEQFRVVLQDYVDQ